jgi:hypothetical protein
MKKIPPYVMRPDSIENYIFFIREQKVMLDRDLAILYHVPVKRLKEQVKRNSDRFPNDFMFELTIKETEVLFSSRSQFATLKQGSNIKYGSYVFTEQGVAMLSGILHSPRAVEVNIAVMRAFVRMRRLLLANQELTKKLNELEIKLIAHDYRIEEIIDAIRALMDPPEKPLPKIGYTP